MSLRLSSLSVGTLALLVGVVACSGGSGSSGGPPSVNSPTTSPTSKATGTPVPGSSATPAPGSTPTPHPGTTSTPTPKPGATATPSPTPVPTAVPSGAFNDYSTFGYDNQRDVFNPNSTLITDATVQNGLHLAWQTQVGATIPANNGGDFNTQTQPVLATEIPGHAGVLFVGGGSGYVYAYDATTGGGSGGSPIWTQFTGQEKFECENKYLATFGVGGTVAYDPGSASLYVVGNTNSGVNQEGSNNLYHLSASNGSPIGSPVDFAPAYPGYGGSLDFGHTSVTLSNGVAYVGTGATCDISTWLGRVAAVNTSTMKLANTFFPVFSPPSQPWGGGGVWGWGGVSVDYSGKVVTGVGNANNGLTENGSIVAPFTSSPEEYSAYGDHIVQLTPDLSTVTAANEPIPTANFTGNSQDLDLNGTPVIYKPGFGCDPQTAIQGKSGSLNIYDELNISAGPLAQFQLAPSSYADGFLGGPAFSPETSLLYESVPSSNSTLGEPGMIAIAPASAGCGSRPSVAWSQTFGPDSYAMGSTTDPGLSRSVPAVSAGGVVFVGSICENYSSTTETCSATTSSARKRTMMVRRPLICCAPPSNAVGGALWALDASTGALLNGGAPILLTGNPIRVPPTIDGKWIFVLDNAGDLYGLTIDPSYPSISTKYHQPNAKQSSHWSFVAP